MPWYQITHTFAVLMAATPVAQRCIGFKAPEAWKIEGSVAPPGFSWMYQEGN